MSARREFVIKGLSDEGVLVYLYPVEGSVPVGYLGTGDALYYRRE